MMTLAENILNAIIEEPKHQLADYLNDSTRNMVLEAIEIGIIMGKNEMSLQNIEFSDEQLKPKFNKRFQKIYKSFKHRNELE